MPSQMIYNESQNHCKKVIGIIHTGSIGIADTLLTKLRATGATLTNLNSYFTLTLMNHLFVRLQSLSAKDSGLGPILRKKNTQLLGISLPVR